MRDELIIKYTSLSHYHTINKHYTYHTQAHTLNYFPYVVTSFSSLKEDIFSGEFIV